MPRGRPEPALHAGQREGAIRDADRHVRSAVRRETALSSFDAGLDFDLLTLTLVRPSPTTAVYRRASRDRHLFGGARGNVIDACRRRSLFTVKNSFRSTETATDRTCSATVATVASGKPGAIPFGSGVDGLDASAPHAGRSNSADLPNGCPPIEKHRRVPPNATVFRKSPHLLNLSRTGLFGFGGTGPGLQQLHDRCGPPAFPAHDGALTPAPDP